MKIHKFKRSIFYSIFFVVILRLLFLFIPIYSSKANLVVPKAFRLYEIDQGIFEIDLVAHTGNKKCLNINHNYIFDKHCAILSIYPIKILDKKTNEIYVKGLVPINNKKIILLLLLLTKMEIPSHLYVNQRI